MPYTKKTALPPITYPDDSVLYLVRYRLDGEQVTKAASIRAVDQKAAEARIKRHIGSELMIISCEESGTVIGK